MEDPSRFYALLRGPARRKTTGILESRKDRGQRAASDFGLGVGVVYITRICFQTFSLKIGNVSVNLTNGENAL
jgi:hypothetical protein